MAVDTENNTETPENKILLWQLYHLSEEGFLRGVTKSPVITYSTKKLRQEFFRLIFGYG